MRIDEKVGPISEYQVAYRRGPYPNSGAPQRRGTVVPLLSPLVMTGGAELMPSPVYAQLGIRRVINAADTYSLLGGSKLPDEVIAAMSQGGAHHVNIRELLAVTGARIAELTHNPAALVVNGAAAGVAIAAAAATSIRSTPPTHPQIVGLRCQRNFYAKMVEAGGGSLVEVGGVDGVSVEELQTAITPDCVALLWFAGTVFERHSPPLEALAHLATASGVALIVDAAAQFPPVSNLWSYRERGADLVIFSGGKGLQGPQSTGLIVGTAELVAECFKYSYPNHSIGRPMKTSKENIVGLLAAIERAVSLNWDNIYKGWLTTLGENGSRFASINGVSTWIDPQGALGQHCPRLFISWEESGCEFSAQDVIDSLALGDPAIHIGMGEGNRTVYVNPYSLLPGEMEPVVCALINLLVAKLFSGSPGDGDGRARTSRPAIE